MIAGWDGSGDHSHSDGGTVRVMPLVLRVRPNTMCPVYFGLRRIDRTPESVHPVAGSGGGKACGSALRRAVMVGTPSLSSARQVNIRATTGARCGSMMRRVLVRPCCALNGTGWVTFCAAYP